MRPSLDESYSEAMGAQSRGDYAQAIEIYEKLANEGHVYSLVMLGDIYTRGVGTEKDLAKAEELLDRAAALGSPEAEFQKANIWLERGEMSRYFCAIQKAARMGVLVAQFRLGLCYIHGRGTTKDDAKALELIRDAASRGHLGAKAHLARRLLTWPFNPIGFVYGLILLLVAFMQAIGIAARDPHDDRLR